jgi:hypothetical protein
MAAPRVLGPSDGDLSILGGTNARFIIEGEDAGKRFSLIEHPMQPHALAAPMHRHHLEDEYSFVLEGNIGRGTSSSSRANNGTRSGTRATARPEYWKSYRRLVSRNISAS